MGIKLVTTTDVEIIRLVEALYNQRPGNTFFNNFQSSVAQEGISGFANLLASDFSTSSDVELAALISSNLGLTGDALIGANAYLAGKFAANPDGRGEELLEALNLLSTLDDDPAFGEFATAFNNDVSASLAYSEVAANTVVEDSDVAADDAASAQAVVDVASAQAVVDVASAQAVVDAASAQAVVDADAASAQAVVDVASAQAVVDAASAQAVVDAASAQAVVDAASAALLEPQTITLTTDIDDVTGGAGDDIFRATMNSASGTYNAGDAIDGASGSDALNVLVAGGSALGLLQTTAVETVNFRVLSGTAAVNATLLEGVETITNASSLDDVALAVSGLGTTTIIGLEGAIDNVSLDYTGLTSAVDSVSLTLGSVGSGSGITALDATVIDLDRDDSGSIDTATIGLSGSNYVNLEGGTGLTGLTLTGGTSDDNAVVLVSATTLLNSLDASATDGTNEYTVSGRSDITIKGGAGDDTFIMGTSLSNNDSFIGGSGTDTVTATLASSSTRKLNTSGMEASEITMNTDGARVDASASDITTHTFLASADVSGSIINLMSDSTINLSEDNLDALTVETVSAGTVSFNIGSATGSVGMTALTVSGATVVNLTSIGSAANSANDVALTHATTLAITTSGAEADLTLTDIVATNLESLTITTNGSAGVTLTSGLESVSALASIALTTQGSGADITLGDIGSGGASTALTSVTLDGNSAADITLAGKLFFSGPTAAQTSTITLNAESGSVVGTSTLDVTATDTNLIVSFSAEEGGTVGIGEVNSRVASGTAGVDITFGDLAAVANNTITIDSIALGTGQSAGSINFGSIELGSTASLTVGNILASGSSTFSDLALDLATGASSEFGTITVSGGVMGDISVSAKENASATFGDIKASSIGDFTIDLAASADFVNFGAIDTTAAGTVGNITINVAGEGSADFGAIGASGGLGEIAINVAASGSVDFATIDGTASVGAITVSGQGFVDIGRVSASSIGTIDLSGQGSAGTFTIDLAGVVGNSEVIGGKGTTTITSDQGSAAITLASATGTDTVIYSTGSDGGDAIENFQNGTGGDVIAIAAGASGVTGGAVGYLAGSGTGHTAGADFTIVTASTTGDIDLGESGSIIVVSVTAFANTAAMVSGVGTGGDLEVQMSAGLASTAGFLAVVWSDDSDSHVTLLSTKNSGSGVDAILNSMTGDAVTIATLVGVDVSSGDVMVTGNFDMT